MPGPDLQKLTRDELIQLVLRLESRPAGQFGAAEVMGLLARLALGVAVVLAPFRYRFVLLDRPVPPVYRDYTDFILFAADIPIIFTLIFWLVGLAIEPRRVFTGPRILSLAILSVSLFGLISVFTSADPLLSVYHLIRLLVLDGLYLFVINTGSAFNIVSVSAAIQLAIQALVAIAQSLRQHSLGLAWLGEYELDPAWQGVSIVWSELGRGLRAYGLTDHPNILGGCLAFCLIGMLVWRLKSDWQSSSLNEPVFAGIFSIGSVALLLTFSRSAWVAISAGTLFLVVYVLRANIKGQVGRFLGPLVMALIVMLPFAWHNVPYLAPRFSLAQSSNPLTNESRAVNERALLNRTANTIFATNALSGVGLGAYTVAMRAQYPKFLIDYQPAHLSPLAAAAEIGIFGALAYSLAVVFPFLALALMLRRRKSHKVSLELVGATALLLTIFAVSLFDYYPWLLAPGRFWQWVSWGLWALAYRTQPVDAAP